MHPDGGRRRRQVLAVDDLLRAQIGLDAVLGTLEDLAEVLHLAAFGGNRRRTHDVLHEIADALALGERQVEVLGAELLVVAA